MSICCSVCKHPKVHTINERLLDGVQSSSVAREFGFSKDQIHRHKRDHISSLIAKRINYVESAASVSLMEKIDTLVARCEQIFLKNQEKPLIALKALSEQRSTFELISRISFQWHEMKQQEIELERLKSGEYVINEEMQFQQSLSVLSDQEVLLLQLLSDKLAKQDASINVMDFLPSSPTLFIQPDESEQSNNRSQEKARKLIRTKPCRGDEWKNMEVRPVNPTPIPG